MRDFYMDILLFVLKNVDGSIVSRSACHTVYHCSQYIKFTSMGSLLLDLWG